MNAGGSTSTPMRNDWDDAPALPSRAVLRSGATLVVVSAATVAVFGELSWQAFLAVSIPGILLAGWALARRAGSGAPAPPDGGRPWLCWVIALALWELSTFLSGDALPTLSDLADLPLASPVPRAAGVVIWFAAGWWLLMRPSSGTR